MLTLLNECPLDRTQTKQRIGSIGQSGYGEYTRQRPAVLLRDMCIAETK